METLKKGSQHSDVKILQGLLGLKQDGTFGPKTEVAVQDFQKATGLTPDGIVGPATWERLNAGKFIRHYPDLISQPMLPTTPVIASSPKAKAVAVAWNSSGALIGLICQLLGLSPAAACAVMAVESGGSGFRSGKMVIRFENHIFWNQWGKANPGEFANHFYFDPDKKWTNHKARVTADDAWLNPHASQDTEWLTFLFASTLDREAACRSISMGAGQAMGFNHLRLGYPNAVKMMEQLKLHSCYQIAGMFDFIQTDPILLSALTKKNWRTFAKLYNGTGQVEVYSALLEQAYNHAIQIGIPK